MVVQVSALCGLLRCGAAARERKALQATLAGEVLVGTVVVAHVIGHSLARDIVRTVRNVARSRGPTGPM